MANLEKYRTLILGDFHFGESYSGEGEQSLARRGYGHSTAYLKPFAQACDSFILNLETPLVNPTEFPPTVKKTYMHWGAPLETITQLKLLNVDAVSLANNHTLDRGHNGLTETINSLHDADIQVFGAGKSINEAGVPYRITLPERVGGGEIHFHGFYQYSQRNEKLGVYAGDQSPGCAPLRESSVPNARHKSTCDDTFHIAFPHWGANYSWRGNVQYRLAHRLLRKDYDLVLGHGGHALQEVVRKQRRWVVYGVGNGNFMSAGRWDRFEESRGILPFSFWTILEVTQREGENRHVQLKLYPVYSNNRETNYQPRPVRQPDFLRVVDTLSTRPTRHWRFNNSAQSSGSDDLGHFISLDLGEWKPGKSPSRLNSLTGGSNDPGDWPLRSPDIELEDEVLGLDRHMGASILALGALTHGGTAHWMSRKTAVLEADGKRFLAHGYGAHESVVGAAIAVDKVLTANLLETSGIATPKTVVVKSEDAAVEAASAISGPVVVKPRRGIQSTGVSANLKTDDEVREAFRFARRFESEVLIQQYIDALEELRVMASPQGALAVNGRVLPHVIGDGASTIRQLIEDKNHQRTLNPSVRRRLIPIDAQTKRQLDSCGLSVESIPKVGEKITVRNLGGISVGADAFQALGLVDPQLTETAVAAVAAIPGLNWGGVDVLIEKDTGRPFVIELNDDAGYGTAMFPAYGEPRNVVKDVWKLRVEATNQEVQRAPEVSEVHDPVVPLMDPASDSTKATTTFSQLLEMSLIRQGYTFEKKNSRVRVATSPAGINVWTTAHGRTIRDRNVVQRVMSRHRDVHSLLEMAGVPRVRGQSIESVKELRHVTQRGARRVFLRPISASWGGPYANHLPRDEARELSSLPERLWIQSRYQGRRVRVLATRQRAMVTTAKGSQGTLDDAHIYGAGKLAVEAVRAIPELRWASVDILIRPTRIRENLRGGLLVEGLLLRPGYSVEDQVLAGDFDSFCREIIQ